MTVEKVKKLMGGIKNYKSSRSAQLENALMHAKAEQVNKDLPRGAKFGAKDLRMLVKEDTAMQNLTEGEKQQYIDNLIEHHAMQNMSVRATNASAARDVQSTLDNVFKMLDSLAVRTGIYACVFASRGHVYDTPQATWFGTDNVMDFWEDVLQMEADEIARKLEQWACMAGRSVFNTAIKEKLGIDLRGWPEGIPFQSPTSLNDLNSLLKVRCALKDGSCHWFRMSPQQHEEYNALLDARHKKGEVVTKPRKKRSDAGIPHKRKGKENLHRRKRARAPGPSMQAPKSAEFVCTSEEESSEDEA
ncbi:hypothetical protein EV424DRAFT_1313708 [Suillus variegatus]|nr:hypothetical protein EV424DRAFT_1313708 [Suillus variegatus]